MKNTLHEIWARGEPVLNGWCSIGNSFSAEIMASQDFDSITIDGQHGALDYSSVLPMMQAMRASGKMLMARVPWCDPVWVMKFLDAGAMGIICPMVNSSAEAAEFVSYLRYPPDGQRSWGPTRAAYAHPGYSPKANDAVLAFAMIETAKAMRNLNEIASTPGLDGLYVGPADLSIGVSDGRLKPGFDRTEPEMIAALIDIAKAAKKNGIHAALHCGTSEYAVAAIEWGYDMFTVSGDTRFLAKGAASAVGEFRALTGTASTSNNAGAY